MNEFYLWKKRVEKSSISNVSAYTADWVLRGRNYNSLLVPEPVGCVVVGQDYWEFGDFGVPNILSIISESPVEV